jgi:predicted Ser/Thr protein kinase
VKRPTLQHETRVLQYVKGQAAIPTVYGYGQLEHFEYMAMELLGPSIVERQKDGAGVMVNTVIRIVDQAVRRIKIQALYITE